MAAIDYGAVIFKNGKQVNHSLFMDMLEAVGWVDVPRILYEDCNFVDNGCSDCGNCPRSTKKHYSDPRLGEWDSVVGDCRGKVLDRSKQIDGNYYAYIGDQHLTFCFYKTWCDVFVDGVESNVFGEVWSFCDRWYSIRGEVDGRKYHLKRIGKWVYDFSIKYKGDQYHVVFGYGIDPNRRLWDKIKVRYVGKRLAWKVDRLYEKIEGGL